jgi:seryl-tRNA synthetase
MQFALTQFAFETLTNEETLKEIIEKNNLKVSSKPFIPMLPPVMIRREVQEKIHRVFGDQTYRVEKEDLNLVASAEHTLAPYHMNEVLDEEELPKRYIGFSTAFRREAGTYGKDMGGIFRAHQFDKSEMESFTTAESGEEEQKFIVAIQEYLMQKLEIPYRLQQVCAGDTGKPDYQQFDIEA